MSQQNQPTSLRKKFSRAFKAIGLGSNNRQDQPPREEQISRYLKLLLHHSLQEYAKHCSMYSPLIFSDNKDPAYEDPFVKASSETIRPAPRLSILQAILAVLDLPENPSLDDI